MTKEAFQPTSEWPLQEVYKIRLHEKIQKWGERVVPIFENMPEEEREAKIQFFEFLMTSVERGDRLTAGAVEAVNEYARAYIENYGRGGGSIESTAGHVMCQNQFEGLYAIFQAGKATVV